MILCTKNCYPCCDFCIFALHDIIEEQGYQLVSGPIGCTRHKEEEYQQKAINLDFCNDFYCTGAQWDKSWININEEVWRNEHQNVLGSR